MLFCGRMSLLYVKKHFTFAQKHKQMKPKVRQLVCELQLT